MNKKSISKILILVLTIIFIMISPNISNAASYSISASSKNLTIGQTASISIAATGLTGRFDISSSNTGVISISQSSVWAENNTPSITATAKSAGTATITVTPTSVADSVTGTEISGAQTITITVTAPVTNPSPVPQEPTFSSVSQTVYAVSDVNIRSSYSQSSSRLGLLEKGQSITRTGIGSNGWSKVSYNGQTGYVMSSYLTTTKPAEPSAEPSTAPEETKSNDATLKSLSITGIDFTPAFDPSITSYTATIGEDITEVEVIAQPTNEKAKVEITGNTALQDGENTVTIVVTAEDGTVKNYEIKLIKGEKSIPLKAFNIQGIKENDETIIIELGEPIVTDNVVEYTITLSEYLKAINILGILNTGNNEEVEYEGLGTFDLVVGENKYTVTVKLPAEEGEEPQSIEYRITINNPEKVVLPTEEKQDVNYNLIIIIALIVVITIIGIVFAILYYKKQNELEYTKPDFAFLRDDENIQNKEQEREQAKNIENSLEQTTETEANNRAQANNETQEDIQNNSNDDNFDGRKKGGKHF